jgi:hypothetical protein
MFDPILNKVPAIILAGVRLSSTEPTLDQKAYLECAFVAELQDHPQPLQVGI